MNLCGKIFLRFCTDGPNFGPACYCYIGMLPMFVFSAHKSSNSLELLVTMSAWPLRVSARLSHIYIYSYVSNIFIKIIELMIEEHIFAITNSKFS